MKDFEKNKCHLYRAVKQNFDTREYVEEELDLWSEEGEEFIKQHLVEIGNKLQEIDLNKDKALNRQIPSVVFELNGWDLLNYILFNEKKVYEPKQREE